MITGRPKAPMLLSEEEQKQLKSIVSSRSLPAGIVSRARIVLMAAEGISNNQISEKIGLSPQAVCKWRQRYLKQGISGLHDELRPGRPRTITDEVVAALVRKTLDTKPKDSTHWTVRSLAKGTTVSREAVHRIWNAFGLQPHRQRTFKLSTDPFFVEKVRDIVGLYLDPPDKALVLCVDEKSQIQALDRTQPILPMGLGYVEGITHDYVRHGTTTLFAALDIATGQVWARCHRRHRHQEYLKFLKTIDMNVPKNLDIHLIVDNYATHKHPKVKRWLALRPRYQVHYTPTYSSWLNQAEIWFHLITQKAIRRGTFKSVKDLVSKIDHFVKLHNRNKSPFVWTATADSILDKINRLCQFISGTQH
ncbi:MAG TPA: IS630 family transposase [Thermodesulfobacteriota bacterium]|nr:IS630 family transposase [Thermodesulfobacteriota bacterium]